MERVGSLMSVGAQGVLVNFIFSEILAAAVRRAAMTFVGSSYLVLGIETLIAPMTCLSSP